MATFVYTLNRGDKKIEGEKKKFSFLKCIKKSNVIKKNFGVLVSSIPIWYLAYPSNRSKVSQGGKSILGLAAVILNKVQTDFCQPYQP